MTLFPLLYLTLELPKRIVNDAISAETEIVSFYGFDIDRINFLILLCGFFLFSVLLHGIMKMRINTMKGILSERLLRRLRYTLISRILRFPAPYFERTSQGELVSMVTSESEPMGGLMGDAVAQPVLQAGQMLTILGFLFAQSIAFGLAACALIPLQAWLIPRMQKKINQLNKKRVVQVRALAAEIGEGAAGASTLRTNGGWRYRMAMISDRLGALYALRFDIFQRKFFMKFANNFIGQMTPFFFYGIGGYLAIKGEITVGALVAALAAYKDLASPWKELLAYYNQSQDMSLRWDTITERFAPAGMIEAELFETTPESVPSLKGDIVLTDVSVQDSDGNAVLDGITATFEAGKIIGIAAPSDEDRRALAELLTREVVPVSGTVSIDGHDINKLHQVTIAKRIGHATSRPVMFLGSFRDNVVLPLRLQPEQSAERSTEMIESLRAGNGGDPVAGNWSDIEGNLSGDQDALRNWWLTLIEGMEIDATLFKRGIEQRLNPLTHPALAEALVELRPQVEAAVRKAGLQNQVHFFDIATYNPTLPVAENLIFATPLQPMTPELLHQQVEFLELLATLGIEDDLLQLGVDMVDLLRQIFGMDGTDHPLFRKLGLDAVTFENAAAVLPEQLHVATLSQQQKVHILAVPFAVSAEKLGSAFPEDIVERVLSIRQSHAPALQASMEGFFSPISADQPVAGLSVLENALFGKISEQSGGKTDALRDLITDVLHQGGLSGLVLELIFEMPLTLGGANLPASLVEPLAVTRATIKRPDILVLDSVLSGYDPAIRNGLAQKLKKLLPEITIICLEPGFAEGAAFDVQFAMQNGRISNVDGGFEEAEDGKVSADLARKLGALQATDLFSGLARKQLRLLAFSARWYKAQPGEYVFHKDDDPTSGAYLVVSGEADLLLPVDEEDDLLIATSGPGKLVGELGLIRNVPRSLDMRAKTELTCLRIGAEEFLDVVGSDAQTAYKLLQVVAGYVTN